MVTANDSHPVSVLTNRLSEIDSDTARHQQALMSLAREADEIKAALKTLRRYGLAAPPPTKSVHGIEGDGKLTVPEMILTVVREAEVLDGATAGEILSEIRRRWVPDVNENTVRPTLWRMVKEERLAKEGDRYTERKKEGPEATAAEPSVKELGGSADMVVGARFGASPPGV